MRDPKNPEDAVQRAVLDVFGYGRSGEWTAEIRNGLMKSLDKWGYMVATNPDPKKAPCTCEQLEVGPNGGPHGNGHCGYCPWGKANAIPSQVTDLDSLLADYGMAFQQAGWDWRVKLDAAKAKIIEWVARSQSLAARAERSA